MTWFPLIIISAVSIAIARVLQKLLLSKMKVDPIVLSVSFQVMTAAIIFCGALMIGISTEGYIDFWPNIILMTVLYTFGNYFLFKGYQIGEASVVSLMLASTTIWTILFSLIFLGEELASNDLVGIGLILLALIILNREGLQNIRNFGRGELYGLITGVFFGIALGNDLYIIG